MARGFLGGAAYMGAGLRLLGAPRVRMFVLVPLLVNTVLFTAAIVWSFQYLDVLMARWLPHWLTWLEWLLWPVLAVLALAGVFFGFTVVANVVAAPFNGFLAEAVERHLGGDGSADAPFDWRRLPRELATALAGEARKLLFFAVRALPFLLLFLVPVLQVFAPLAWFVFGAWVLTHEYADFPMGNHDLSFADQRRLLAGRRALTLGFGCSALVLTLVPVLNFLAMPAAVAGATVMWTREFRDRSGGA